VSSTNFTKNNILNYNFGATGYTPPPATMYFGLSKTTLNTGDISTGSTGVSELILGATGYARESFANDKTNWSTSTAASLKNNLAVSFPQSTGIWSAEETSIKSTFVTDGPTGVTNIWWYSNLNPELVVPANTVVSFPIEGIAVTETGLAAATLTLNRILNYHFGKTSYDPDGSGNHLYFGLSTTEITASGLTNVTEPLATSGYARVEVDNDKTTWTTSSGTTPSLNNDIPINFPKSTASWGIIVSIFIADVAARGGGNVLWYKTLTTPIYIQNNTVYTIPSTTGFSITSI
jgi:hypothetical protein